MSLICYALLVVILTVAFFGKIPWQFLAKHPLEDAYKKSYQSITKALRKKHSTPDLSVEKSPDSYKFYEVLALEAIDFTRRYGSPYREVLEFLRTRMIEDYHFEQKSYQASLAGFFQFVLVAMMSWGLYFAAHYLMELPIRYSPFLMALSWQLLGVFLFMSLSLMFKKNMLGPFEYFYSSLFSLYGLCCTGLPLGTMLHKVKMDELKSIVDPELVCINNELVQLVDSVRTQGSGMQEDILVLIGELNFLQDKRFSLLNKKLEILKLAVLIIFFVTSYFFLVFQMVSFAI